MGFLLPCVRNTTLINRAWWATAGRETQLRATPISSAHRAAGRKAASGYAETNPASVAAAVPGTAVWAELDKPGELRGSGASNKAAAMPVPLCPCCHQGCGYHSSHSEWHPAINPALPPSMDNLQQKQRECIVGSLGCKERRVGDKTTFLRRSGDNCISTRRETHTLGPRFLAPPNQMAVLRSARYCSTLYEDLPVGINQP